MNSQPLPLPSITARFANVLRASAVWTFIATLAWAPFPLGGAIAWASGLQSMAIAVSCMLWLLGSLGSDENLIRQSRIFLIPGLFLLATLTWAGIQIIPGVPASWAHPIWAIASDNLHKALPATISINPWHTQAEITKLSSYMLAAWLVFRMARRSDTAKLLLRAVVAIGALYALYGIVLNQAGILQTDLFYALHRNNPLPSGPFMLHNSFATYCGLATIAALVNLFADGSAALAGHRHVTLHNITSYAAGRGLTAVLALLISFGAVVASASRAGFAATLCGLFGTAILSLFLTRGRSAVWAVLGAVAAVIPLFLLITMYGGTLNHRVDQLLASDAADAVRLSLWAATNRMISDAPLLGLGLGTFEDAYPLYAAQIFPYVMDKAHCDYLEFAAGLGLPAAILWWGGLLWLNALNIRALIIRHQNRIYPLIALGASIVVGVHSSVDFSLQLPAVALLYATLMGLGMGQCQSMRRRVS
jgi:Lipid A core - O-antigen ligase and related enzymes